MRKIFSFLIAALFSVSMFATTYTVAGGSTALFGSSWNEKDTNNDMELVDGLYIWTKADVALSAGIIEFKIVKDHDWSVSYGDNGSNFKLNIAEDAKYTVTITFSESINAITASAEKTAAAVVEHNIQIKGSWDNWAEFVDLTKAADGKTAAVTLSLAKKTHEFKVVDNGNWLSNAATITREANSTTGIIGNNDKNISIEADAAGEYTFTWTFETSALEVTFPEAELEPVNNITIYFVNDRDWESVNAYVWDADENNKHAWPGEAMTLTELTVNEKEVYSFTFPETYVNIIFNNGTEQTDDIEIDAEKRYFSNGEWYASLDDIIAAEPLLANGFYLIGQKGWDFEALSDELRFASNPDNEGEYQLNVNLNVNDAIKVVLVQSDALVAWFPENEGTEYIVDANHAGAKTIYFRPEGNDDWAAFGGFFYIAANETTGISNSNVEAVAVKFIENGQLFIRVNGKVYSILGK